MPEPKRQKVFAARDVTWLLPVEVGHREIQRARAVPQLWGFKGTPRQRWDRDVQEQAEGKALHSPE